VPLTFVITHKIIYKDKIEVSLHQFLGFALFLLISASWYIAAINNNEGLFDYFFNNQLVERVSENKFKRGKPFYYYIILMPVLGLPWVIYLLFYFKNQLKTILKEKKNDFILLITFLILFLVLSVSTSKLILYILPLFFIIAIFSAKYLSNISEKSTKIYSNIYAVLITLVTLSLAVLAILKLNIGITLNVLYTLIVFVVFAGITFLILKKTPNNNYLKPVYLGVVFIISIIFSANGLFQNNESKINSVKPIAVFIEENSEKNAEVVVYNYLLPSLSFYLNQDITTVNHGRYTTQREIQFETNEDWRENLINYFDPTDRARILEIDVTKPTYLIKRKKDVFPDTLQVFANKLKNKKEFETFEVYY
jgi:4-amino-4-deoxy-L-arabinose transferase